MIRGLDAWLTTPPEDPDPYEEAQEFLARFKTPDFSPTVNEAVEIIRNLLSVMFEEGLLSEADYKEIVGEQEAGG